jgi:hypothetical protein
MVWKGILLQEASGGEVAAGRFLFTMGDRIGGKACFRPFGIGGKHFVVHLFHERLPVLYFIYRSFELLRHIAADAELDPLLPCFTITERVVYSSVHPWVGRMCICALI